MKRMRDGRIDGGAPSMRGGAAASFAAAVAAQKRFDGCPHNFYRRVLKSRVRHSRGQRAGLCWYYFFKPLRPPSVRCWEVLPVVCQLPR